MNLLHIVLKKPSPKVFEAKGDRIKLKIHIVQKGDTLWKIAKNYGVDFEELKAANSQLASPDMIMPGMKIKVPSNQKNVQKTKVKKELMEETQPKKTLPKTEVKQEIKPKQNIQPTPKQITPDKKPEQMMEMPKFEVEIKQEKKIQLPKAEMKMPKKEEIYSQPEQVEIPKVEKQPEQMMPTSMPQPLQPSQPIQPYIQYVPVYYPVQTPCCPLTNCNEMHYQQPAQEMYYPGLCADQYGQQQLNQPHQPINNWNEFPTQMAVPDHMNAHDECTCNYMQMPSQSKPNYYQAEPAMYNVECRENESSNPVLNQMTYTHEQNQYQAPTLHSNRSESPQQP